METVTLSALISQLHSLAQALKVNSLFILSFVRLITPKMVLTD